MFRFGNRVPRAAVKREIHALMRSFPDKAFITVKRTAEVYNDLGEKKPEYTTIYQGEALMRPGSGTSQAYGLGTVENLSLVGLINGVFDIRQSDVVTINDGREYEVAFPPHWFGAFTVLQLKTLSQIGQPTTQ